MAACPYNVRVFNWQPPAQVPAFADDDHVGNAQVPSRSKGIVEKCTFCVERTDHGELPACVQGCPAHARTFGDLNDPESEVSQLISERRGDVFKVEFGTQPSVYYLPRRRRQTDKKTVIGSAASAGSDSGKVSAATTTVTSTAAVATVSASPKECCLPLGGGQK